jgi:uncharacterized protein YecE (DUF72 family)
MAQAYVGTSGWNYAGWKGDFYASVPRKFWLQYYASRLNALEVDGTFYHLMRESTARSWYERTPRQFRFSIKGHRYITHIKRLEPPANSIRLQRESVAPLREKLAAVLWQLPPSLQKDIPRLARFIESLDGWREARHVFEFRHESWFDAETAALMRRERVAVCQSDASKWPMWDAVTTDLVFVRLHGHTATYSSNYDGDEINEWAVKCRKWLAEACDVHVYFDNDARGYAPWNALSLADALGIESGSGEQFRTARARQRRASA